jgi:hypothetical protein
VEGEGFIPVIGEADPPPHWTVMRSCLLQTPRLLRST